MGAKDKDTWKPAQDIYVVLKGNERVLLHAYLKKAKKAPTKEIEVAKQRMKTVIGD